MIAVAPTDRPKSARNCCVIEKICSVFEDVYCFICGRRRVAVARYRMICLILVYTCTLTMHCLSFRGVCHTTASDLSPFLFKVNYLSQFLIAAKLIPVMKTSGEDCRILLVSSAAYKGGEVNLDTIQARNLTNDNFQRFKYYSNTKLFQVSHVCILIIPYKQGI